MLKVIMSYMSRRHRQRQAEPPLRPTTSWGWLVAITIVLGVGGWYCLYLARGIVLDYDQIDALADKTTTASVLKLELAGNAKPLFVPSLSLLDDNQPWMYVAKSAPLAPSFTPRDLVTVSLPAGAHDSPVQLTHRTAEQLGKLFAAADKDGTALMISSAYRSIVDQQHLYDEFVAKKGATMAAQYVAAPGSSEHHTGQAVDVTDASAKCSQNSDACNLSPESAAWLAENAPRYGFVIRYPSGKQPLTGVAYEPWHLRYVGPVLAGQLTNADLTLDEFVEQIAPGRIKGHN